MSNNFKQLAALDEAHFRESGAEQAIRGRLEGTLGTLQIIGAVLEVYLPRLADTVVGLSGGDPTPNSDVDKATRPNLPEGPAGPREPDDPRQLR